MNLRLFLAGLAANVSCGFRLPTPSRLSPLSIFAAASLLGALAPLPASAASWAYITCPRWFYGNEVSPADAARRSAEVSWGVGCAGGSSCVDPYPNPTTKNCIVGIKGTPACGGEPRTVYPTVQGQDQFGQSHAIHPDDQGYWHCAVSIVEGGTDPFKGNGGSDCPDNCQGNPINIGNGNKFQKEVDLAPGYEGAIEFYRYYNSQAYGWEQGIGANWTHTYSRWLRQMASNQMHAFRPDGKTFVYRLVAGNWVADSDTPDKLVAITGGWKLTTKDDEVEIFDTNGLLQSITTRNGATTTLIYTDGTDTGPNGAVYLNTTVAVSVGKLLKVTDDRGRTLQFTYVMADGNIARITDPAGNLYQFQYDLYGNLWKVKYPGTPTPTRTYHYNESAHTSGANLPLYLTGITDENAARFATYQYFSNGKAKSTFHAGNVENYSMTYSGGTTTWTDPFGGSHTSTTSIIQGVAAVTGTTQTCTGCGGTTSQTYGYDADRNVTSRKDFNGNLTCYSYNSSRQETARTEGLSGTGTCTSRVTTSATRTITTEWHATQRVVKRTAEPLRITTFAHNGDPGVSCAPTGASTALVCSKTVQATTDADGSLAFTATSDGAARVWTYTYNASGQILTINGPRTDVTDVTTHTYYTTNDTSGNYRIGDLASITNALNQTTQFTQYDAHGRLKKMIDPNGLETILAYSPRGWLISRQVGTTSAGYETTSLEYDSVGQLKKLTQPDSSYVQYTYDNAHRLTQIQDGLGNKIVYTLDARGNRIAENSYDVSATVVRAHTRAIDALNRVKQEIGGTNPTTQITQQAYDGNGNLTSITDPLSRVTTQIFDARNRLTEVRDPFNGSTAPTKYQYNGQDQLTKVTDPANLDTTYTVNGHGETISQVSPDTGTTSFTFDAASNLATKTDARNITATYSYDAINRLTQIAYPDETVIFTYDTCTNGVGRLCSISDNSGTTTYTYNVKGRVTAKSQTVSGLTRTMGYSYNSAGQLTQVTTPSGKAVVYGYSNNRPVSVTVDGTTVLNGVFYEPFGPNGGWKWGNSTIPAPNLHTRVFDKDFRATRITSDLPAAGAQPYFDRQIGWDDQNRITSMADLANSALNASFGYDALDRLTSASQGTSSWGYTYSGVGDRLTSTVNSATTNYSYTTGTHRLSALSGAQTKSYTVDANGNMTSDGTITWTYGGNNRSTSAGSTTFLVNALGQRVKKAGTSTTHFLYDEAGRLWGEYDGTGALIAETIWLDDLPVATYKGSLHYVHPDHLGTPRLITRPSDNTIVWRWDNTEPFGNAMPDENPSGLGVFAFNLRFPGQYFDAESGKHYNYFRDYDLSTGRFIQSDPVGLLAGLNTYAYVEGSPLSLLDDLGLAPKPPICSGKDCPDPPLCPTPEGPKPCPQPGPSKPGKDKSPKGDECAKQPLLETCIECCAARNRFNPGNISPCIVKNCTDPRGLTRGPGLQMCRGL